MLAPESLTGELGAGNLLFYSGWIYSEFSSRLLIDCREHG